MGFPEMPFATVDDLEEMIGPLSPADKKRALKLLVFASQKIKAQCPRACCADPLTLHMTVLSMVSRAMQAPEVVGVESVQQGAGPYQASMKLSNPDGALFLTREEKRDLGCGRQRAFMIDLMPSDEPGGGGCCGSTSP